MTQAGFVFVCSIVCSFALGALWAGPRLYHERLKRYIERHPQRRPVTGDELAERLKDWTP